MKIFGKHHLKVVLAVTLWIFLGANLALAADSLPTRTWSHQSDGGNNGNDAGYSVAIDSHGNVITAGYITGAANHAIDAYAVKYDPNGNVLCTITADSGDNTYNSSSFTSSDSFSSVKVDSQDNIILGGTIAADYNVTGYYCAVYLQKYDSNCNPLWSKPVTYNYPGDSAWNSGYDLTLDKDDNIYIAGAVFAGWGVHEGQWAILKYDKDGNLQSPFPIFYDTLVPNYAIPEYPYGIAVDSSGNVIACGTKGVSGYPGNLTNDVDWHVRKYDPSGTLLWEDTYGGTTNLLDYAYKVAVDSKDDIIVVGFTNKGTDNSTNANYDWLVIKYSKNGAAGAGQRLWTKTYESAAGRSEQALNVTVDSGDNVVVVGYVRDATNSYNMGRVALLSGVDGTQLDEIVFPEQNLILYGVGRRGNFVAVSGYVGVSPNYDIFTALLVAAPPLIAPTEGTAWESRSKQTILWDKTLITGKSKVNIQYSIDSGQNWITIKTNASNNGKYIWTIPDISPSESIDTCVVVVSSVNSPMEFLASPPFSIGFPQMSDFNEKRVYVGDTITITGNFFGTKAGKVYFGTSKGKVAAGDWTPTSIKVQVPKNTRTGPFTVFTAVKNEAANFPSDLVILPLITKVTPASASVGKKVTILGSGFGNTMNLVSFNGTPATVLSWKDTSISVQVPIGATTGRIQVTNSAGDSAISPTDFQVK
ncbi:MAG: IPT/TIG domain-containing protein [Thermodesulfobacteriota bacterium]